MKAQKTWILNMPVVSQNVCMQYKMKVVGTQDSAPFTCLTTVLMVKKSNNSAIEISTK